MAPPVDGPKDIDRLFLTSPIAWTRIAWFTPGIRLRWARRLRRFWKPPGARSDTSISAIRRSVAFPVQLGAVGRTLMVQQGLRRACFVRSGCGAQLPALILDAIEVFTDTSVFVGLEYRTCWPSTKRGSIARPMTTQLAWNWGPHAAECGLYEDAARNLLQHPASIRAGLWHCTRPPSHSRAGKLESAARAGSDALSADPGNERARAWLWLTAQKMGGYPSIRFQPRIACK